MVAPYSLDLRQRVIGKYKIGNFSQSKISKFFDVSTSTIKRWLKLDKENNDLRPKQGNFGRPRKIDDKGAKTIKQLVEATNTITLAEIAEIYFKKYKVKLSNSMISRELKRLNLRRKKLNVQAIEKESPKVKKKR